MNKYFILLAIMLTTMNLTGCYNDFGSDEYSGNSAGQAQTVRSGTIIQTQKVVINDKSNQGIGMLAGAAAGAILGSTIGGGSTAHALGGVAGGVAGGAAGNAIGSAAGKQDGIRYIVKLNSGNALSIVQGTEPKLRVGQKVLVLIGSDGRDRVIADTSQ